MKTFRRKTRARDPRGQLSSGTRPCQPSPPSPPQPAERAACAMAASPARERSPPGAAPTPGAANATVYVGNLSGDTERDQLREAMATFGRVATATVRAATQNLAAQQRMRLLPGARLARCSRG